jgi:inorganic triphosphatase YgiF
MGIEYERKYKATPETLEQLKKVFRDNQVHFDMETTYYDTPNGDFSARHWTVRRRMENEKSVCTFKFPVDAIGRGEFEVEAASIEEGVAELCKLSGKEELAALAARGLIPVCGAKFHRIAVPLVFGSAALELALDQGILSGGGREIPLNEVEAELKTGDPKDVDRFGAYLQTVYGLEPEQFSKFARAKALAKGDTNHV